MVHLLHALYDMFHAIFKKTQWLDHDVKFCEKLIGFRGNLGALPRPQYNIALPPIKGRVDIYTGVGARVPLGWILES